MPTAAGEFRLLVYTAFGDPGEQVALVAGDPSGPEPALVRLHSECLTGDVFGSQRCDCGAQLQVAMGLVARRGCGVVLYLRQEGRGIGLLDKVRAYRLQERGLDTVEANHALGHAEDLRDYRLAAAILRDLGVEAVELLTNNPRKVGGLEACGIRVARRVPLEIPPTPTNLAYLRAKRDKLGHDLNLGADAPPRNGSGRT